MLPYNYICTCCRTTFSFPFRVAFLYLGSQAIGMQVADSDLLQMPLRPAWCKTCNNLCVVEDIAPVRAFEDAYACVRRGHPVEYPLQSEGLSREWAVADMSRYLRWRLGRQRPARSLCCGSTNYQFMDVAQPLFKHAGCDFGVVEEGSFMIGSYCGPRPGVRDPANFRVYDAEGELIGLLTWYKPEDETWCVEPLMYPRMEDELA